ncbi:hypothetical protein Stube_69800 [Streptomyces tubercidicus]|uniref:Uncharacterized protein n=1 Tax=Streptomyces tubercidicus TaxID=47759 RepID=A0A640V3P8_9ACTN|nr:hypothetical protein Stube_00090 [Streptomyces tubercidicus]GFE42307.1 hypothetical protein Stube_69800 [Streptomyces tubercidicus]
MVSFQDAGGATGGDVPEPRGVSALALITVRPSELKRTESTVSWCPRSTASGFRDATSHKRTVWSAPPLATVRPSGENATDIADWLWRPSIACTCPPA